VARTISTSFRQDLENVAAEDVPVFLATITHASMSSPLYINSDIVDYTYNGHTYVGMAFSMALLTDDDTPPRGKISVHNVDTRISEWFQSLTSPPELAFVLVAKSDFTDADPHAAIGTPAVEVSASHLFMRNISVNAMTVSADLTSYDVLGELWPQTRTTAENTPALYR
jgi:hypothetical protein